MSVFYVVKKGHRPGIYKTWLECKSAVDGFKQPIFKKFASYEEATIFYNSVIHTENKESNKIILRNGLSTITDIEMHKIKEMSQHIKSSPFADDINYNVNAWNCIANNNANTIDNASGNNTSSNTSNASNASNASNDIYIFTDGSARKSKTYFNSGIGVYLGFDCINIKEQYNNKTNNQCELIAMDYAFKLIVRYYRELSAIEKVIKIVSDSEYSIKACSVWLNQWKKNNWLTSAGEPVKNKDIIESIDSSMTRIKVINSKISDSKKKIIVKLIHVNSHQSPDLKDKFKFNIWFGNYIADGLSQNTM